MNRKARHTAWMALVSTAIVASSLWAQSATRPAAERDSTVLPEVTDPPPASSSGAAPTVGAAAKPAAGTSGIGTVKGENVYVRSGFSPNYYPVIKLNTGDTVTIVGSEFGWLKILPPKGTFSLVEKSFVDKIDDKTGTINDQTWVNAGSDLSDRNYAKQVKLDKGTRIQIVGEKEGFYKIEPPSGAHVWISGEFVDRGGAAGTSAQRTNIETVKPGELPGTAKATTAGAKTAPRPTTRPVAGPRPAPEEPRLTDEYQVQIKALEAEITAELTKPVTEQVLDPILLKMEQLAQQDTDKIAQLYAQTRLDQLRDQVELIAAVQEIRDLRQGAVANADEIARRRALIKNPDIDRPLSEIVCKGEIQVSGIYDGIGGRPKRWRVVDPGTNRITAYIEVPPGSPIDPVQYYGKYIGIRASARELLRKTIPPVPIFTVMEIKVLDPESLTRPTALKAASMASPRSPSVAAPSSQPAGERAEPPASDTVDTSVEPK